MSVTLDGQILFDESACGGLEIKLSSIGRHSVEKAVPGLDGVLSIDLGQRTRTIKQTGVLRARSRSEMDNKITAISAFMDGRTHKLVAGSVKEFDNLRMDSFKISQERVSGGGVVVDYEIIYTQLII